jgi:hypothetical protein
MPHFEINQRYFPHSKVCGFRRNGVRHAPFWCALYTVLLCDMHRIMQEDNKVLIYSNGHLILDIGMKQKKKTTKKRSNKYQKKISIYGIDEKEVVKELLKSPPMPKEEEKKDK